MTTTKNSTLPELVTVGAMHKCRADAKFDQCVNCGAVAEELAKPCKKFMMNASHASRTEQAAPSVASGDVAALDVERLGVPTLESELRFMHEHNPLEGYKGSTLWHRVEAALAAPGAAIAAREQQTFEEWAEERGRLNIRDRWADGSFVSTNAQLALEVWNAALASRQESPAASAQEEWMPVTPEQHSEAFAAGDLMALAEEAGGARMAENVVQVTRSDIERIIYFAKNREDTAARSPATVAQPVTDEQIRRLFVAHGHLYAGWLELGRSILALRPPRAAAQPCPSQGCGGDGGEAFNDAQIEVLQFLTGVGKLRGCGFGEKPAEERGNFWWRSALRAAFPGIPVLSTDKGDGGSKE